MGENCIYNIRSVFRHGSKLLDYLDQQISSCYVRTLRCAHFQIVYYQALHQDLLYLFGNRYGIDYSKR